MVHKKKLTEFEKYSMGSMEQDETWWGKKIIENAKLVRSGKYGKVVREWKESSGWMDGVIEPNFEIIHKGKKMKVRANESGVFVSEGKGVGSNIELVD
jgi:hypothetical protein